MGKGRRCGPLSASSSFLPQYATTVKPGRVNALGTIIAVLVLAVGIAGLQQFGFGFSVETLFPGASLVLSVGLAGYAARRRAK